MTSITTNIRLQGTLNVGFDQSQAEKWVAETVNHARNIFNIGTRDGPQTGRIYRKASSIVHQASKAGQWPAVDTGNLRINTRTRFNGLEGELGSNVEYAEYLQVGTRKMSPRKLYKEAMEMAIQDRLEELAQEVIFVELIEFKKND